MPHRTAQNEPALKIHHRQFFVRRAIVAAALTVSIAGCGDDRSPQRILRLGHGLDTTHPVHRAMEVLARELEASSQGELTVEIYPSEQLGSEREAVELLQIGSLAMTKVSASVLESFAPSFRLFSLPYLFDDREHLFRVLEGELGQELLEQPREYRLRGLCYYDAGSRSFYTRERPVLSPADLEGLKIRTQESRSAMQMVRALGGGATPIAWGELYTALQQGVVDGAENNPPSFHLSRHYEVAGHYSLDEHTQVPDVLLISSVIWDRLSSEQQRLLIAAAEVSAQAQKRFWQEASDEAMSAVEAAGVTVHRPDKRAFRESVEPLLREARSDPEMALLLNRVEAARRESVQPP